MLDEARGRAFRAWADRRFARRILPGVALGAIPLFGLPAALGWYRATGADAYGAFAGWRTRVGRRVALGLAMMVLAALQLIPLVGAAATAAVLALLYSSARLRFTAWQKAPPVAEPPALAA